MNYSSREIDTIKKENEELREWSAALQKSVDDYQKVCDQLNTEKEELHSWTEQQYDAITWLKAQNQNLKEQQRLHGEFYINKNGFDHIVSLGYNCEASFRIGDYLGSKIESFPFSWAYIKDQSDFPAVLSQIAQLPSDRKTYVPSTGMFYSEGLNIFVHTRTPHIDFEAAAQKERDAFISSAKEEMQSRFSHLTDKWNQLLVSEKSVLFIMKCQTWLPDETLRKVMIETEQYFERTFASGKFYIVAVVDREETARMLGEMENFHLGIARVKAFAPDDQTETGGDRTGWIRAIEHFNHIWDERQGVFAE